MMYSAHNLSSSMCEGASWYTNCPFRHHTRNYPGSGGRTPSYPVVTRGSYLGGGR